jgi:RNase H-fold protein (predicted Holliday junction resolvase)
MTSPNPKYRRTLAIAPSTRGVGYAVMEGFDTLVNWGVKPVKSNKNAGSLSKVKELIAFYDPELLVLSETAAQSSRRAPRIRMLTKCIARLAKDEMMMVVLYSQEQVRKTFFPEGRETKHELATQLAQRYPEELGDRLPHKRKPWESEHSSMDIFEAVALALMPRKQYE